jgi:hypothetical protein
VLAGLQVATTVIVGGGVDGNDLLLIAFAVLSALGIAVAPAASHEDVGDRGGLGLGQLERLRTSAYRRRPTFGWGGALLCLSLVGGVAAGPVLDDPRLDVVGQPHLTHGQAGDRVGEALAVGDLVDALPHDPEPLGDLTRAHEPDLGPPVHLLLRHKITR